MRHGLAAVLALGLSACTTQSRVDAALQRMTEQPKYEAYGPSRFFGDGSAMRSRPQGTVSRGEIVDSRVGQGRELDGTYLPDVPLSITADLLDRGRSRFEIFCAVCHGAGADGVSVVASNMAERPPPSLRRSELLSLPPGYYYHVIRDGLGRMPSFAAELPVEDRWAVVAYLRELQRSPPLRDSLLPRVR